MMSATALSAFSVLPTIDLDGLNNHAALQSRVDTKYLMTAEEADALPALLPAGARVLQIGNRQRFAYHSVYFDPPALTCFYSAAYRRRRRFKVRTRAYCDSSQAFLEVKVRGSRSVMHKERIPHDFGAMEHLSSADMLFIWSVLEDAGITGTNPADLVPTLATGYHRQTFYVPGDTGPSRVTVDTGLYWELMTNADGSGAPHAMLFRPTAAILETKSSTTSNPVNKLLWHMGYRPRPISKYCTGLAALEPGLSANHWNRSLKELLIPAAQMR